VKIGIHFTSFARHSGIGRYTQELVKALSRIDRDNDYILITSSLPEIPFPENFLVEDERLRFKFIHRKWGFLFGKRLFRDIDVFHFPDNDVWYSKYTKTVVTLHDIIPLHFPDNFFHSQSEMRKYLSHLKFIAKNSDRIITVSQFSREDIIKHLYVPPEKVQVVYNGVSNEFLDYSIDKQENKREGLLFVGALDFRKNVSVIIRALRLLIDKGFSDQRLKIVGKERGKGYLKKLKNEISSLNLETKVEFISYLSDKKLQEIYRRAKVFLFPSLVEGFGLPVLEAMASGTPVVASNIPVLQEITGGNAYLVDAHDESGFAEAIGSLLKDENIYRDFQRKGWDWAKNFSWENAAKETLQIYKEVARNK